MLAVVFLHKTVLLVLRKNAPQFGGRFFSCLNNAYGPRFLPPFDKKQKIT